MDRRKLRRWGFGTVLLLGTLIAGLLTLSGCGGGYDTSTTGATINSVPPPILTKTDTPLIDAATLKKWVDAGLVNVVSGEKVVILTATTRTEYDKGHIPGAFFVDNSNGGDLNQTRLEGVAFSGFMVPEGVKIDKLIQRTGINKNTTIVFTTSGSQGIIQATRAYFVFRYWGFPKERLKVLDGRDSSYAALASLTTSEPVVASSTYSVTPNGVNSVQAGLRASIGEMIAAVRNHITPVNDNTVSIIDVRNNAPGAYLGTAGSSTGLTDSTKYIVFEGHILGAQPMAFAQLTNAATGLFKSKSELETLFGGAPFNAGPGKMNYTYCQSGTRGSDAFFVLDAILGWPVALYDGSWGQWGDYSNNTAKSGKLPAGSVWATDSISEAGASGSGTAVTYNQGQTITVNSAAKTLAASDIDVLVTDSYSLTTYTLTSDFLFNANQVENADKAYLSPAVSGSNSTTSSGSSGGC